MAILGGKCYCIYLHHSVCACVHVCMCVMCVQDKLSI